MPYFNYSIESKNLNKTYNKNNKIEIKALVDFNLKIPKGSIYGLLGPNGAGKSTFINVLGGLVKKDSGNVKICGLDIDKNTKECRKKIGIVPQELNMDPFFTPIELLELQAGLYGVKKSNRKSIEILSNVGLLEQKNAYARTLSGGMRRRLLVAKSLVHDPDIIILDEPTAGVDVELRQNLWKNVSELNKIGVTIILTTHNLYEAQDMCDRIGIINKGNLVALDSTSKLLDRIETKKIKFKVSNLDKFDEIVLNGVKFTKNGTQIEASYDKNKFKFDQIINVVKKSAEIVDISTEDGDLEDIFLKLTNR